MDQFALGMVFAAIISFSAYKVGSLTPSGAWVAFLEGSIIFGLGGWRWAVLLLAFFISSSLLTRLFATKKAPLSEKFEKGGKRDAGQVLANGWVAALMAGLHYYFPTELWPWLCFGGSLASVTADTWATELGVLNPNPPVLLISGRKVERGTSGGISSLGTLAAFGGALFIGILSGLVNSFGEFWIVLCSALLGGLAGSFFDSLLGATVQAIYTCPKCGKETEKHPEHTCGTKTTLIRGWSWLNNDLVNLGCACVGAISSLLFLLG